MCACVWLQSYFKRLSDMNMHVRLSVGVRRNVPTASERTEPIPKYPAVLQNVGSLCRPLECAESVSGY